MIANLLSLSVWEAYAFRRRDRLLFIVLRDICWYDQRDLISRQVLYP